MNHNVIPILEPITVRPVVVRWDARVIRSDNAEAYEHRQRLRQIELDLEMVRKVHQKALLLESTLEVERRMRQTALEELV